MAPIQAEETPVLRIRDLSKNYGGLQVLTNIRLDVHRGKLHALIGSNGAGKTTLFDIICGFTLPTQGSIQFMGKEITNLPAFARAHHGIARTFQITTLFRSISVFENLRLTLEALPATKLPFLQSGRFSEKNLEPMRSLLETWGLWETRYVPVAALPYGIQRQLEIVMALIQRPKLLLLDEPMAGLEAGNRASMSRMIKESSKETTVLFIEHDMTVALELADRVTALHLGEVIAEGTPEEIQGTEEVQRIYFGLEKAGSGDK